jgi:hypothetical protein
MLASRSESGLGEWFSVVAGLVYTNHWVGDSKRLSAENSNCASYLAPYSITEVPPRVMQFESHIRRIVHFESYAECFINPSPNPSLFIAGNDR